LWEPDPIVITVRRAVISVILAACFSLLFFSFTQVRPTHTAPTYNNPAVTTVTPAPGDAVLRQSGVEVTLKAGFALAYDNSLGMAIGGVGIPQDQLVIIPGLNQYFFTPGDGKQLAELPASRVCVGLLISRTASPADPPSRFSWCFQTH
jgi:hypothetical protein